MFDFYFFFFFFFVDVFANQDVFAKAHVFFFIIGNTFDISFTLTEIFVEQMWVIIGQILEYNWRELWLFEFEVAFSMGSAAILSREMTVVSDFVMITSLIIIK